MIRILHSVSNMDRAGVETMLMNYYRYMDREKVQFDFLANKPKIGDYEDEICQLGGRIFRSPGFKSYPKYSAYMKNLLKEHPEYKILHTHNGTFMIYALKSAKECRLPVRIAHAHATAIPLDFKMPYKMCLKPFIKRVATHLWGCSEAAGEFYFSKKKWHNKEHQLIHNAVEVEKFSFNEEARQRLRKEYGLEGKFVIGHAGRFAWVKNHKKIVEIFNEIYKQNPDARLVLVGVGELEETVKAQVKALGLSNAVVFTGLQTNVDEWYSVFDVFVMPSHNEGLPVVGIEAQTADLPCLFSSAITPEVKILDKAYFLNIKEDAKVWADKILSFDITERKDRIEEITNAGYNIKTEAKRLQELYLQLYSEINH